jgi:hypothetical protein
VTEAAVIQDRRRERRSIRDQGAWGGIREGIRKGSRREKGLWRNQGGMGGIGERIEEG